MKIKLNDEDNLIFQSIAIGRLLLELKQKNFLDSDYFNNSYEFEYKDILKEITLDSQGVVLILMYIFFVIPKEVYESELKDKYDEVNKFIKDKIDAGVFNLIKDDYNDDDFVRHMRNSISHSKVRFEPKKSVSFFDDNKKICKSNNNVKNFCLEVPLSEVHIIIGKVHEFIIEYYINRIWLIFVIKYYYANKTMKLRVKNSFFLLWNML